MLDLSIAVVLVRTFAISRGVLRYCERLASHDTALRAAGAARSEIYRRLATGPAALAVRLHSGELVARVGADVDALADVLVRALVPMGVAAVLMVAAVGVVGCISPSAAIVLAVCLLVAGVVAPALAGRAAERQEAVAREQHSERDTSAMLALEHAPELRVAGALPGLIAESQQRQRSWGAALDAAARPAAIAEALPTAAVGVSVLGAVVAAIGMGSSVAPTTLAVLMLLPLSAFEATTALPAAAVQADPVADLGASAAGAGSPAGQPRRNLGGRTAATVGPAVRGCALRSPGNAGNPVRGRRGAGGAAGGHRRQRLR